MGRGAGEGSKKNSCWTNSFSKSNVVHHSRLPRKEFREWGRFLIRANPPLKKKKKKSKTFFRERICLAEVQTEPRWLSIRLMILGYGST